MSSEGPSLFSPAPTTTNISYASSGSTVVPSGHLSTKHNLISQKGYAQEEYDIISRVQERFAYNLTHVFSLLNHDRLALLVQADHAQVARPDSETPFVDTKDVIDRLLPYHVFQQPNDDLSYLVKGKIKEENDDRDPKHEIHGRLPFLKGP
jgi:hypothetical protein